MLAGPGRSARRTGSRAALVRRQEPRHRGVDGRRLGVLAPTARSCCCAGDRRRQHSSRLRVSARPRREATLARAGASGGRRARRPALRPPLLALIAAGRPADGATAGSLRPTPGWAFPADPDGCAARAAQRRAEQHLGRVRRLSSSSTSAPAARPQPGRRDHAVPDQAHRVPPHAAAARLGRDAGAGGRWRSRCPGVRAERRRRMDTWFPLARTRRGHRAPAGRCWTRAAASARSPAACTGARLRRPRGGVRARAHRPRRRRALGRRGSRHDAAAAASREVGADGVPAGAVAARSRASTGSAGAT